MIINPGSYRPTHDSNTEEALTNIAKALTQNLILNSMDNLLYICDDKEVCRLDKALVEYLSTFKESEYIFRLKDNWDDEGGMVIKYETWLCAINFVKDHAEYNFKNNGIIIKPPRISHGSRGGIDILWQNNGYRCLLFMHDTGVRCEYYFHTLDNKNIIDGSFNTDQINYKYFPVNN